MKRQSDKEIARDEEKKEKNTGLFPTDTAFLTMSCAISSLVVLCIVVLSFFVCLIRFPGAPAEVCKRPPEV